MGSKTVRVLLEWPVWRGIDVYGLLQGKRVEEDAAGIDDCKEQAELFVKASPRLTPCWAVCFWRRINGLEWECFLNSLSRSVPE